ncbi:MAG: hypothetical protein Kow001_15880 [Acidobacteriota bacterium]
MEHVQAGWRWAFLDPSIQIERLPPLLMAGLSLQQVRLHGEFGPRQLQGGTVVSFYVLTHGKNLCPWLEATDSQILQIHALSVFASVESVDGAARYPVNPWAPKTGFWGA